MHSLPYRCIKCDDETEKQRETKMETITVKTWNGDRKMTREQFVQRWTAQIQDVWAICHNSNDRTIAERIRDDIAVLAGNSFDKIYRENMEKGNVA